MAGVNLEDSRSGHLVDPVVVASKIAAIKCRTPDIFVNARVDNFWFAEDPTVDAVLRRAHAYADSGADGIFVPGLAAQDLPSITAGIRLSGKVLAHPTMTVAELGKLGVKRVSSGSLPNRAAVDAAVSIANALRENNPLPAATPYWEMQSQLIGIRQGLNV